MSLKVTGVRVSFGGNTVLAGVGLDAIGGQVTALIGPNGAGKTTLFNVITGVVEPRAGTVELDGKNLSGLSVHRRARAGLGRTFQRLELFGTLTVAENLWVAASGLARRDRSTAVEAAIARLGLGPVAEVRSGSLPTGTGRLVELGRALVTGPAVLLLDEPASGQNTEETEAFSALLGRLASDGLTILLVEHDMDLVMQTADRIHVLDFGQIIASGRPEEVRADPAVQAAYLGDPISAADL
ncbi:MAG TPA: ABC transporter ATP-binding protein [Acidimicrobiales bacterium]|nr:ABC transporter ATP-binding protein [Acidimicrobiales bacterium]